MLERECERKRKERCRENKAGSKIRKRQEQQRTWHDRLGRSGQPSKAGAKARSVGKFRRGQLLAIDDRFLYSISESCTSLYLPPILLVPSFLIFTFVSVETMVKRHTRSY
jgi:hypothetical protein